MERRLLQISVAIAGLAPVAGGLAGVFGGAAALGEQAHSPFDSHFRYLSGLLVGLGVAYWSTIPDIERQEARISLVTLIVVTGGFFRALGLLASGSPGWPMRAALVVELVGAPLLYLWQRRIAQLQPMDAAAVER